jgi:1,4-dihydroxy-2-naphthoate octaprenyltransferase
VLLVNNYRDLESDTRAGRHTLVAMIGRAAARQVYAVLMLLPYALLAALAMNGLPGAWLGLVALPQSVRAIHALANSVIDSSLNDLLAATARSGFILGAGLAFGLANFAP